jgi:thiol-disulfide isomerase/thioredoxin
MGAGFQVSDSQWWVVCLCAQWCGTCRDYRATFDQVSSRYPQAHFVWLDVEDREDLVGDIDVETFPTLLIAKSETVYFFGPLLPQIQVLVRVLDQLDSMPLASITGAVVPEAKPLWQRIRRAYGG